MSSLAVVPLAPSTARPLRILFLVSAHNSLSQRAQVALTELGHDVRVAVVATPARMEAAVARHRPELIVCPMLKTFIPGSVWRHHRCLVVHPGPKGDRGPSSLDWAIELGMAEWGVTVLEATREVDGGDVWATRTFPTREAGKSSLYRHEVRRAAVDGRRRGRHRGRRRRRSAEPLDYDDPRVTGRPRPLMRQDRSARSTGTPTDRHRDPPHPRRRGSSRRARHDRGHATSTCSAPIARARCAARRARSSPSATARSAAPPSTAPSGSPTSSAAPATSSCPATRALALAGHALDVPELPAPLHAPPFAPATLPRDLLRGAPRRRLPALRLLQRRDEHRPVPPAARRLPLRARAARRR